MSTTLTHPPACESTDLSIDVLTPQAYAEAAKSPNTRRAYQADWRHLTAWCQAHHHDPLPASPGVIADYLTQLAARYKFATIQRRLVTISQAHKAAGLTSPTSDGRIRLVLEGIARTHGVAQARKAELVTEDIKAMVAALPTTLIGHRDRALLLVGFAGAFRRSELVSLDRTDVQFTPKGLIVTLRRSKTDQRGEGEAVGILLGQVAETCPVRALQTWLKESRITAGPIFRPINRHGQIRPQRLSAAAVAEVVKRTAEAAGLDATLVAGHSLRAGFATAAIAAGVDPYMVMKQTRHKSQRVFRRYDRTGALFTQNASGKVGL